MHQVKTSLKIKGENMKPKISVIMGSTSDWSTMICCCDVLKELNIVYETQVVSAHRTPDKMFEFAENAKARGIKIIIAGAGGAAHLPGMVAAKTSLPVLGVPIKSSALGGMDSLLSMVQMPGGIPVATLAIGEAGAKNSALFAASVLALSDEKIELELAIYIKKQTEAVLSSAKLD